MRLYVCVCVCVCVCVPGPLTDNGVWDEGAAALAEALRHNCTLKELYLRGEAHPAPPYPCRIAKAPSVPQPGDSGSPSQGRTTFTNAAVCVCVCVCVCRVCVCVGGLADNDIRDEGARVLAKALFWHDSTLKCLDLGSEPYPAPPYSMMRHSFSLGSLGLCMRPGDCLTEQAGIPFMAT